MKGNDAEIPSNANPFDACGINRSAEYPEWRCLPNDTHPSSFNILKINNNKNNNFEHIKSIALQGVDTFFWSSYDCILDYLTYGVPWNKTICYPPSISGADADLAAIAAFIYNNSLYTAGITKSGMYYVFEIPSGDVIIARKIGPWSGGGGGQFSISVDENAMIAVITITGGLGTYYSKLSDNKIYCGGVTHAIDLLSGKLLYQIPNPWALTGNECRTISPMNNNITLDEYVDYSIKNSAICERGNWNDENPLVININISNYLHINLTKNVQQRATYFGPTTISNNLLFIPSITGDIFINNLLNGKHLHTLRCEYELNDRRGVRAGVTVIEDRIIYYCGDFTQPLFINSNLHSLKLPNSLLITILYLKNIDLFAWSLTELKLQT